MLKFSNLELTPAALTVVILACVLLAVCAVLAILLAARKARFKSRYIRLTDYFILDSETRKIHQNLTAQAHKECKRFYRSFRGDLSDLLAAVKLRFYTELQTLGRAVAERFAGQTLCVTTHVQAWWREWEKVGVVASHSAFDSGELRALGTNILPYIGALNYKRLIVNYSDKAKKRFVTFAFRID
jgi:hypothetical protein